MVPAYFGALLFALHSVQVESVAWASGAKDVLAGALSCLALLLYVKHAQANVPRLLTRPFLFATAAYALALLAKPSAMTLPVVAILIDRCMLSRRFSRMAAPMALWLAMAIAIAVVAKLSQPASHIAAVPLWQRPVVAFDAIGFYVRQLFAPIALAPDYGRTPG